MQSYVQKIAEKGIVSGGIFSKANIFWLVMLWNHPGISV